MDFSVHHRRCSSARHERPERWPQIGTELRFTADDWARIERDWSAWWKGELERPIVLINGFAPPSDRPLPEAHLLTSSFPLEMPAEEVIDRVDAWVDATHCYCDAFPRWWPNFGPGIMAGFLGSEVHCTDRTVWFSPSQVDEVSDLCPAYDPDNVWWRRVKELTAIGVRKWGDQVVVGHTDLGGNLDVLASLRTTDRLLLDLYDAPEEVERLVGEITPLWLRYFDELDEVIRSVGRGTTPWAPIWSPGRCYMLQCDFSFMISPAMFERFALPDLTACCEAIDHGIYHLDGKGEIPHLDILLSIKRLRGIQWIPGDGAPPPEEWLPLLKRIRDGGKLCQLFVSPQGALTIVRELGGRGFALQIMELMDEASAEDFLKALASADPFTRWAPPPLSSR